ncbi:MAG: hypothetical protein M3Z26_14845 [Bacteroidota bacterium]|nr:hypothetical protein [Bacteroidota bacterium]
MQAENEKSGKFIGFLKDYLAIVIVIFSFAVIILLLVMAFSNLKEKDVFPNIKDLMGLVLPIIGTWMGTILAFYFSKENFESASRSMQQTISKLTPDEKLKTTKAKDVMIPIMAIDSPFNAQQTKENMTIPDLIYFLDKNKRNRIVVMDENKIVTAVIHRSIFDSFMANQIMNQKKEIQEIKDTKIEDMQTDGSEEVKDVLSHGVEFIQQDATLYEAQQLMIANKNCQDVFLTATGRKEEPVIGWITNVIITDNARV